MLFRSTLTPGTYTISIDATVMPSGTQVSPSNQGGDDTIDSDANDSGTGQGFVVVAVLDSFTSQAFDFGFHTPQASYPGTGTPGYWKNHPSAWPVRRTEIRSPRRVDAVRRAFRRLPRHQSSRVAPVNTSERRVVTTFSITIRATAVW